MNEQMREALQAIETVMEDAYHRRFAECCGNGHGECCGDFIEQWTPEDNKIMETLAPIQRQLSQALASEGQAEPAALMPDWMQYDPTSDVLTLHGKKYAASMFGRNGFLGQPGDLLRLNKSESDTVCLTKVNINQPAEPVAWATFFEDEQVCELFDNKASAEAWRASDDFFRGVQLKPLYTHPPAEVVRQLVQCAEDAIQFIGGLPVEVTGYRGGYALKSDLAPSVRLIGNLKSALAAAKEAGL